MEKLPIIVGVASGVLLLGLFVVGLCRAAANGDRKVAHAVADRTGQSNPKPAPASRAPVPPPPPAVRRVIVGRDDLALALHIVNSPHHQPETCDVCVFERWGS